MNQEEETARDIEECVEDEKLLLLKNEIHNERQ